MTSIINASTSSGLTITPDNSGNVLLQYNGVAAPAFHVYGNANQGVTTNVATKVQLNTKVYDTANAFDATTNYRFTPTVAGYYQFSAIVGCYSTATTLVGAAALLYKNGSVVFSTGTSTSAVLNSYQPISGLIYLNGTTDYVELWGSVTASTGPLFASNGGLTLYLTGCLLRGA